MAEYYSPSPSVYGVGGVANFATDYLFGKNAGEDDIRALAGATGSTAGAAIGAAIGSATIPVPIVGTVTGAAIGSTAGGWLADRGDELVRGNRGNTMGDDDVKQGWRQLQEKQERERQDFVGQVKSRYSGEWAKEAPPINTNYKDIAKELNQSQRSDFDFYNSRGRENALLAADTKWKYESAGKDQSHFQTMANRKQELQANRENFNNELRYKQAKDLLDAYTTSSRDAGNQATALLNTKWY